MKISVVIPAKNRAKTLPACLDSLLIQTFPVAEVIVVDDSSTDNTKQVIASYSRRGVRYVRLTQATGAQAARNLGVRLASYDWIAFQDSDDIWLPEKLEMQVCELKKHDSINDKLVHCNAYRRDIVSGQLTDFKIKTFSGKCYSDLLLHPGPMFPSFLVYKSKLEEIGFLDDYCPSYQEWDTAIRLAKVCEFIHVEKPLFEWCWHSGETISKDMRRDIIGYQYVLEKHKQAIIAYHGHRRWRRVKAMNMTRALRYALWDEVQKMIQSEPWHPLFAFAGLFARFKVAPRGTGRLLYLAAL